MAKKAKKPAAKVVKTQKEVAGHFDVTLDTIRNWRARTPPMPGKQGHYDLEQIAEWKEKTFRQPRDSRREDAATLKRVEILNYDARIQAAKAEAAERKNQLEQAQIVRLDDVEQFVSEFLSEARRQVLRIPRDMKQGYPENLRKQIEEDLRERLEIYLKGMHAYMLRLEEL